MGLFSILGRLTLDTTDFQAGVKRAETTTNSFANNLSSSIKGKLGAAFSVAAVTTYAKATAGAADNILNLADAYSITTDRIQLMQEAAARNGVQVDQMLNSMVKVGEARKKAMEGDVDSFNAFSRFNISMERLNDAAVDNYDIMQDIAKATQGVTLNFREQNDLFTLLGASGIRLVGAIKTLEGLKINLVPEEALARIDKAGDKYAEVFESAKRANLEFAGGFLAQIQLIGGLVRQGPGAIYRSFFGKKPTPQAEEQPAGSTMPDGYMLAGRATGESFDVPMAPKKPKEKLASIGSDFRSSSNGGLQAMGGYWFGAEDAAKQDLAAMRADIKRIADSVNKVATQ